MNQRHECKYLLTETRALALRHHLRPYLEPDRHTGPQGCYTISSLYLDSRELTLHRETLEGRCRRYKLRIRAYSDDAGSPVFLEVKRRSNAVIAKSRAHIARRELVDVLASGGWAALAGASPAAREFAQRAEMLDARPVVLVRYQREAHVGALDPGVRVTFDRQIMSAPATAPVVRVGGPGWHTVEGTRVVLELKFTGLCPAWMSEAVQRFDLRRLSYSKYSNAVQIEAVRGLQVS